MPQVGNKSFPYTKEGQKQARKAQKLAKAAEIEMFKNRSK